MDKTRTVIPINEDFFNDGYWYVLGSTSLGGQHLSPKDIGDRLQQENPAVIQNLLRQGICLPLYFPADCCLDEAIIILGDLTEQEEQEWIGRLQGKLEIPCGEFMVMGGGLTEDFEIALNNFEPPDPHFQFFQKIKVDPGTYFVEIYAFAPSINANELWEDADITEDDILAWWHNTHPDESLPLWLRLYTEQTEESDYDKEEDLVDYIIRLVPMDKDQIDIELPKISDEGMWCGVYEMRQPEICPVGLSRTELSAKNS